MENHFFTYILTDDYCSIYIRQKDLYNYIGEEIPQ